MKLKELRARYNMTQTELGEVTGVTSRTVARWESGRTDMSFKAAVKIARYLKISLEELVGCE